MGNSSENTVLGTRVTGELRDRYEAAKANERDGKTNADFLRELIDAGLKTREESIYTRLGCEDSVAARVEEARKHEESREDVIARFLRLAVENRARDELDHLDVGDDLRQRVEAAAEEDEPLDVTIRHLLREGLEQVENENSRRTFVPRLASAIAISVLSGFPALYAVAGEYNMAGGMVLVFILAAAFAEEVNQLLDLLESKILRLARKVKP